MDVFLFLLVSTLEWFSLIVLSFTLFKFNVRWYKGQIIFSSFLLSLLSYILFEVLHFSKVATLFQPPIVFLFYWQIFRIAVFYAGLMVVNGYLGYLVINMVVFTLYRIFGVILLPGTPPMYLAQTISALAALLIAWLIHKYRVGFTFVPHGEHANVKFKGINLRLLLFTIIGYVATSAFNFLYLGNYTLVWIIITTVTFGLLQYWVFRKEYNDDD